MERETQAKAWDAYPELRSREPHTWTVNEDPQTKDSLVDRRKLRTAVLRIRAIDHDIRKSIIDFLDENGSMKVTDIYIHFRLEQSVTSQHLAIMRRANVLTTERDGKEVYYSVNYEVLNQITNAIEKFNQI